MLAAGCDTGDGKQLQPYDPADYPAPTPTTDVTDSSLIGEVDALGSTEPEPHPGDLRSGHRRGVHVDGAMAQR